MTTYKLYISNTQKWGLYGPDTEPAEIYTYWGAYYETHEKHDPFKVLRSHFDRINRGELNPPRAQLEKYTAKNLKGKIFTFVMSRTNHPIGDFVTVDFIRCRENKKSTYYLRFEHFYNNDEFPKQSFLFILDPIDHHRFTAALHRWRKQATNEI